MENLWLAGIPAWKNLIGGNLGIENFWLAEISAWKIWLVRSSVSKTSDWLNSHPERIWLVENTKSKTSLSGYFFHPDANTHTYTNNLILFHMTLPTVEGTRNSLVLDPSLSNSIPLTHCYWCWKNGSGSKSNREEWMYTWFTIRYLSLYWAWHVLENIYKIAYLQVLVLTVLQV